MIYRCPVCKTDLVFEDILFSYLCTVFTCSRGHKLELDYDLDYDPESGYEQHNFRPVEVGDHLIFAYFEYNEPKALYSVRYRGHNACLSLESFGERELSHFDEGYCAEKLGEIPKRCDQLMSERDFENYRLSDPEIPVIKAVNYKHFYDLIGYDYKKRKYYENV